MMMKLYRFHVCVCVCVCMEMGRETEAENVNKLILKATLRCYTLSCKINNDDY